MHPALFGLIFIATPIGFYFLMRRGGFNLSNNGRLGAVMSSSKSNKGLWMVAIATILGLITWYFWSDLVSFHEAILGPNVSMWWYVIIIPVAYWLFGTKTKSPEKSLQAFYRVVILAAVGYGLIMLTTLVREDTVCPDKQAITTVPATGMVLTTRSCWDGFLILDLRQLGRPKLAFDSESAVLRGRTVDEFAYIETSHRPGSIDGHVRLVFNRKEMMRIGLTELPIFISPADYQPGAVARFDAATLEALSK